MGNKSSATKVVTEKTSTIVKNGMDRIMKKNENISLQVPSDLLNMSSTTNTGSGSQSKGNNDNNNSGSSSSSIGGGDGNNPMISDINSSSRHPAEHGFDPNMLKEMSKWSVKRKPQPFSTTQQSDIDNILKDTAGYIRQKEYQQYKHIIKNEKSIPGRLTGSELSKFLEKYREQSDKEKALIQLAEEFKLELSQAKMLVKWSTFPFVEQDDLGEQYVKDPV